METSAEEMFKELGFTRVESKWYNHCIIYTNKDGMDIIFDLGKKAFRVKVKDDWRTFLYCFDIPFNLMGAINKQVIELKEQGEW